MITNMQEKKHNDNRIYIAIDLKSFYASVECRARSLDPLNTNLVVADDSRTEKTICLAVTPSLKSHGVSGRARLFEVIQKVREVNAYRRTMAKHELTGKSVFDNELKEHPDWEVDFIIARPRMALYMEISTEIYDIYLKYVAPEDMHVYSVDEVFLDVTQYLRTYGLTAHELAMRMIRDVLNQTGITATAGIGTNMYLAKVAMDIVAKHIPADKDGVRIAELDEMSYRRELWDHTPLTDFWRVGRGYATKLERYGLHTMGDIARASLGKKGKDFYNEEMLYDMFGVNAELLIDHAWGYEPATIQQIRAYKPENNSLSSGQVLTCPYEADKGRIIVREMTDLLVLDLVDKGLVTDQIVLTIGYDVENLLDPERAKQYHGPITIDHYGRKVPKHAHGTANLGKHTSSTMKIIDATMELYDRIIDPTLLLRRVTVAANHVIYEADMPKEEVVYEQMDLFTDYAAKSKAEEEEKAKLEREKRMQKAILEAQKRFGKNAILKGMSLQEGATTIERNSQIGGHKA